MPQLSDITEKREKKKFTKRSYRPWDLSGQGEHTTSNATNDTQETKEQNVGLENHSLSTHESKEPNKGNELDNNKNTFRQHNEINKLTQSQHIDNPNITLQEHNDYELDNKKDNIGRLIEAIRNLTGIQEKIFNYVVDICSARGVSDSGHLQTSDLAVVANCSIKSAKTSLTRLIDKKLIIRKKGKRSKGGYISLYIDREVQAASVQAKMFVPQLLSYVNFNRNNSYLDNSKGNASVNNQLPSSSSINIYKTTTTTDLPYDWKEIDCSPLKEINFSLVEILNIFRKCPETITPAIVQDSINQFSFGLINNAVRYKGMNSKSAILVSSLIQGTPWTEEFYVSEEELNKIEKRKRIVDQLEKTFKLSKFSEWFSTLTNTERENLVSDSLKLGTSYQFSKEIIEQEQGRAYFEKKMWPELLEKLITDFLT
jgi:predicted transcriptional regulator